MKTLKLKSAEQIRQELYTDEVAVAMAQSIIDYLVVNGIEKINGRDLRRGIGIRGVSWRSPLQDVDKALDILLDKGWIVRVRRSRAINGRPRKDYWVTHDIV